MPRQKVVQLHLPAQYAGGWCRDHAIPPKIAFQNVHGDFLPFKSWVVRFHPPAPDRARHTSCLWLRAKSRDFYMRESGDGTVAAKSVRAVRLRPSVTIVAGSPATRAKAPQKSGSLCRNRASGTHAGEKANVGMSGLRTTSLQCVPCGDSLPPACGDEQIAGLNAQLLELLSRPAPMPILEPLPPAGYK